jgi:hypothetical protein
MVRQHAFSGEAKNLSGLLHTSIHAHFHRQWNLTSLSQVDAGPSVSYTRAAAGLIRGTGKHRRLG